MTELPPKYLVLGVLKTIPVGRSIAKDALVRRAGVSPSSAIDAAKGANCVKIEGGVGRGNWNQIKRVSEPNSVVCKGCGNNVYCPIRGDGVVTIFDLDQ